MYDRFVAQVATIAAVGFTDDELRAFLAAALEISPPTSGS